MSRQTDEQMEPRWSCARCGTVNIPAYLKECDSCHAPRSRRIWHLNISTFAGVVGGAVHFVGQLYCESTKYGGDLTYRMTRAEAADFNRFDGTIPRFHKYRAGDTSSRWADASKLRAEAIRIFEASAAPGSILLLGNPAYADPREPIAGDDDALAVLIPIWKRWEKIDGWEGGETVEVLVLEKQWDAELRRLGFDA